jgi:cysteine-rich repeat protein
MGHDHNYERTLPLRAGRVVAPGPGTIYITTGGGGQGLYPSGHSAFTAYSESVHHFTRVTIDGPMLLAQMVRVDGAIRDAFTLDKDSEPPPARCGDGIVQPGEQCDDGRRNSDTRPNACRTRCRRPSCGDGVVDAREECEPPGRRDCDAVCRRLVCPTCRATGIAPLADTYIEAITESTWDHGRSDHLDVDLSPRGVTYLKFDLSRLTQPVRSAELELFVTNSSDDGGRVYRIPDSSWVEGSGNGIDPSSARGRGLKWTDVDRNGDGRLDARDRSPLVPDPGRIVGALGPVTRGHAYRVDVTRAFRDGPRVYTLAIMNNSSDGVTFGSREDPTADRRPVLHIVEGPPRAGCL